MNSLVLTLFSFALSRSPVQLSKNEFNLPDQWSKALNHETILDIVRNSLQRI